MEATSSASTEALIAELYKADGKAEIVDGRVVRMSPTGRRPGRASGRIYASLSLVEKRCGGYAYPDNVAFLVNLPHRKSFSPDASFSLEEPTMSFGEVAPEFAAEVRSDNDYGPAAEKRMSKKRADYFAAGTKVVWDVDLLSDDVVRVYRTDQEDSPTIYRRGQLAEAEPAVPGWVMAVDELFE